MMFAARLQLRRGPDGEVQTNYSPHAACLGSRMFSGVN
jgi:hypothetical protein